MPRSIYPTTFTCSSSPNDSPRRYDVDNILAGPDTTDPFSTSKEALERVATVAKKYSIEKLALDEDLLNKRERFRSSHRKRVHKQRIKRQSLSKESSRIKVRSKPSAAVMWIFSFMDCIQDKEKKKSSSPDPINQALKEVSFAVTFCSRRYLHISGGKCPHNPNTSADFVCARKLAVYLTSYRAQYVDRGLTSLLLYGRQFLTKCWLVGNQGYLGT